MLLCNCIKIKNPYRCKYISVNLASTGSRNTAVLSQTISKFPITHCMLCHVMFSLKNTKQTDMVTPLAGLEATEMSSTSLDLFPSLCTLAVIKTEMLNLHLIINLTDECLIISSHPL